MEWVKSDYDWHRYKRKRDKYKNTSKEERAKAFNK